MTVTTSERPTKRSGAATRRPDWTADATLAEMIRRILAVGEPQKIVLFGSRRAGMPARTATMICCWSSLLCFRATSAGPLSPRVDRAGRRQGYPGLDAGRGRPVAGCAERLCHRCRAGGGCAL